MAIDFQKKEYQEALPLWTKCRDITEGQEQVHKKGELYLPKLSGQNDKEYRAYRDRALFYNASSRTVDGMTGLLFRKAPKQEGLESLKDILQNIDLKGNNINNFAEKLADEVLKVGRLGLLVDYPQNNLPEGVEATVADTQAKGLRPFVVQYKAENIINWSIKVVNNIKTLSFVVLKECTETYNSDFETTIVTKYRLLMLDDQNQYFQRIYVEQTDAKGKVIGVVQEGTDVYPMINAKKFGYIPFFIVGPNGIDYDVQKAPILDLVNVNISHYKTSADIEHAAHFTALPTPVVKGHAIPEGTKLKIGSSEAWIMPEENADAFFLEFEGAGIEALEGRLSKKENQMAALGARMLVDEKAAVESAETHNIKRQGENSALSSVAQSLSDGITKVLKIVCEWNGSDGNKVKYEINKDFIPQAMDPQALVALIQAYQTRSIAFTDFIAQLQKGEIIAADRTPEMIKEEIDAEPINFNDPNNTDGLNSNK